MKGEELRRNRLLMGLIAAVAVWGSTISLGAFLFGYDQEAGRVMFSPSFVRGLIPLGCVTVFVGSWVLLVWRQGGSGSR